MYVNVQTHCIYQLSLENKFDNLYLCIELTLQASKKFSVSFPYIQLLFQIQLDCKDCGARDTSSPTGQGRNYAEAVPTTTPNNLPQGTERL